MTAKKNNADNFFNNKPRKQPKRKQQETTGTYVQDIQKAVAFFWQDLVSILGQWPIKNIPERNKNVKIEEQNTPEMDAEIKEIFWDEHKSMF